MANWRCLEKRFRPFVDQTYLFYRLKQNASWHSESRCSICSQPDISSCVARIPMEYELHMPSLSIWVLLGADLVYVWNWGWWAVGGVFGGFETWSAFYTGDKGSSERIVTKGSVYLYDNVWKKRKYWKKLFQQAFGCTQHLKACQNTQQCQHKKLVSR